MALRLAFAGHGPPIPSAEVGVLARAFPCSQLVAPLAKRLAPPASPSRRGTGICRLRCCRRGVRVRQLFFGGGDVLAAKRYFSEVDYGNYTAAGMLARALPMVVARCSRCCSPPAPPRTASVLREQLSLLGLYAVGPGHWRGGVAGDERIWRKDDLRRLHPQVSRDDRAAGSCDGVCRPVASPRHLALASRWFKMSLGYGLAGLAYWLMLLIWANLQRHAPPHALGTALAFAMLLIFWLITLRTHHSTIKILRMRNADYTRRSSRGQPRIAQRFSVGGWRA